MIDKSPVEKLKNLLKKAMPRNGPLLFSIEQWELIRRLRNSGLTKEQIGQAFDDLNKIEQDLGSMYSVPANSGNNTSSYQNNSLSNLTGNLSASEVSSKLANNQIFNNMQIFQMAKSLSSMTQQRQSNSNSSNNSSQNGINFNNLTNGGSFINKQSEQVKSEEHIVTQSPSGNQSQTNGQITAATAIVNSYFASIMEPDQETKLIEEFKLKGEVVIHSEISFFVYKHDLKQSQIARMAGVNQAYVSKFLRGEFFDLSENGKSLIYKWYIRFLKNPQIFHTAHNISVNPNNISNNSSISHHLSALEKSSNNKNTENGNSSFNNMTNINTYDTPKRSRFSFKSEHLTILEKAFNENQYPDQKKREELAKLCNEAKTGTERVTEQIITHWFQNKRKIIRKSNMDDHSSGSPTEGNQIPMKTNQFIEDFKTETNNNIVEDYQNDMNNGNIEYQTESPGEFQDFIDDDCDYRVGIDRQSPNSRNRSIDSNDF